MKSIGAEVLLPDALPGVNHMRENQNDIVYICPTCPYNI